MEFDSGTTLTIIGLILLAGLAAHKVGRRAHVPRVTLLLGLGALVGPAGLSLIPAQVSSWFGLVTRIALAFVGFLLGEQLAVRREGHQMVDRETVAITLIVMLVTLVVVTGATWAVGVPLAVAIVYGGIATATDPAATLDVIKETNSRGPLSELLMRIVALDDALGLILFAVCLVAAEVALGGQLSLGTLGHAGLEILVAGAIGVVLGLPMAWLTGRIKPGSPTMVEAAGFIFLCAGVASLLHVSYLLAAIVMGTVVARRAKHHERAFHEIENVGDPFLVVFFFLAGFAIEPDSLVALGWVGGVYVVARIVGRLVGGWAAGRFTDRPKSTQAALGWSLLPQAGVALGLALLARERIGEVGDQVLHLVIATTVLFEIIGPLLTRWRLSLAGETGEAESDGDEW